LNASDQLVDTFTVGEGLECPGLAAEPDGHFTALVWDDSGRIYVNRFDLSGTQSWSEELTDSSNSPTDFNIGDSRFEYGNGTYGAYYHVHSNDGHQGDTLKWVDAETGTESTEWDGGCSHSISDLLRHNPALDEFLAVCVTDCAVADVGGSSDLGRAQRAVRVQVSSRVDADTPAQAVVARSLGRGFDQAGSTCRPGRPLRPRASVARVRLSGHLAEIQLTIVVGIEAGEYRCTAGFTVRSWRFLDQRDQRLSLSAITVALVPQLASLSEQEPHLLDRAASTVCATTSGQAWPANGLRERAVVAQLQSPTSWRAVCAIHCAAGAVRAIHCATGPCRCTRQTNARVAVPRLAVLIAD
jgi:hypothetical protein